MKLVIFLASVFVTFFPLGVAQASQADQDGNKTIIEIMLIAKVTGMCGVYKQMANFQDSTDMPGGTEFMNRFLSTELARLGMSEQKFMKYCTDSVDIYTKFLNEFSKEE